MWLAVRLLWLISWREGGGSLAGGGWRESEDGAVGGMWVGWWDLILAPRSSPTFSVWNAQDVWLGRRDVVNEAEGLATIAFVNKKRKWGMGRSAEILEYESPGILYCLLDASPHLLLVLSETLQLCSMFCNEHLKFIIWRWMKRFLHFQSLPIRNMCKTCFFIIVCHLCVDPRKLIIVERIATIYCEIDLHTI